jgi:glycosyltransferase involved in cell wall biosynthesis
MRLLERLSARFRGDVTVNTFGCSDQELELLRPSAATRASHLGVLTRAEVADLLRRSDVFIDLSTYQAFGRGGLEAMACGAVPILPVVGGVHEYARHRRNALLVDSSSPQPWRAAQLLIEDPDLLRRLRIGGLETAERYTALRAAVSVYELLAAAHRQPLLDSRAAALN